MVDLELLAPARNADIGIAAIDCGADAVYIGGPGFGARAAACNEVGEISRLAGYAHRFGARVFVTFNTVFTDEEEAQVHSLMLQCQEAGADAFIIRDTRILAWKDITVPLHASTQCAIRNPETARRYREAGCSRVVVERQLSLEDIRRISTGAGCEVEAFVHGALCVGYSGQCRLSQAVDGRSADRGECIQACRSLYDLVDSEGKVLVRNKALLSLRDLNLRLRLKDLAEAGVCSFKIEGRLKNISYVRNVVRSYSQGLDDLVAANPSKYRRSSFGRVEGGFTPDLDRTFNRSYTELWIDGKRGRWASVDAPKSMGERLGRVAGVRMKGKDMEVSLERGCRAVLSNGDGFAFVGNGGVTGFRGDVCEGLNILCKPVKGLVPGTVLFRNISASFEKELENNTPRRCIPVEVSLRVSGKFKLDFHVRSEDGREFDSPFNADLEVAQNRERAEAMIREQISKHASVYSFHLSSLEVSTPGGVLPLLSASTLNGIRRLLAEDLDGMGCSRREMYQAERPDCDSSALSFGVTGPVVLGPDTVLMKSRYCIRFELGLCPLHQGAESSGPLFLLNNGRRLALHFDCSKCEMGIDLAG